MTDNAIPQVGPETNPTHCVVFKNPSDVGDEVRESSKYKTERRRGRRHCEDRHSIGHKAGANLGEEAPFFLGDAHFHAKQSLPDTAAFLVGCPGSGIRKEIGLGIKAKPAVKIDAKVYPQVCNSALHAYTISWACVKFFGGRAEIRWRTSVGLDDEALPYNQREKN